MNKNKIIKLISLMVCVVLIMSIFSSCSLLLSGLDNKQDDFNPGEKVPQTNDGDTDSDQNAYIETQNYLYDNTYTAKNTLNATTVSKNNTKSVLTVIGSKYSSLTGSNSSSNFSVDSGFFINSDGYFLTTAGTVLYEASNAFTTKILAFPYISVTLNGYSSSTSYSASVVKYDWEMNVALCKLSDVSTVKTAIGGELSYVSFANSNKLTYGEDCMTISALPSFTTVSTSLFENTYALNNIEVLRTEGVVSRPHNELNLFKSYSNGYNNVGLYLSSDNCDYLIQTSVITNARDGGAPLFDSEGKAIGLMMTEAEYYAGMTESNNDYGISFAIPSDAIKKFLESGTNKVSISFENNDELFFDTIFYNKNKLSHSISTSANYATSAVYDKITSNLNGKVINSNVDVKLKNYINNISQGTTTQKVAINKFNSTVNVVSLYSYKNGGAYTVNGAQGSGFIINDDGYIVTNSHVITDEGYDFNNDGVKETTDLNSDGVFDYIYIYFENGYLPDGSYAYFQVEVVDNNTSEDMAILKIVNSFNYCTSETETAQGIQNYVKIASSSAVRLGDACVAIGNGLGLGNSVVDGVISKTNFNGAVLGDSSHAYILLQITCPINSGNSGGALLNANGDVIGINTLKHSSQDGICWSIPSDRLKLYLTKKSVEYATA